MVKDHSDSERGNPLPPHGLLFPINSKGSFICTIPQTGYHIPRPLLHQLWSIGWNENWRNNVYICIWFLRFVMGQPRARIKKCGAKLGTLLVGPGSQSTCTMVCRIGRGAQLGAIGPVGLRLALGQTIDWPSKNQKGHYFQTWKVFWYMVICQLLIHQLNWVVNRICDVMKDNVNEITCFFFVCSFSCFRRYSAFSFHCCEINLQLVIQN